MPNEADRRTAARRAFLSGDYFTRAGRRQLALRNARQGLGRPRSLGIDTGACLAWRRMICRACADACDEGAIRLRAGLEPRIDESRCTRCAECVELCPVDAVLLLT